MRCFVRLFVCWCLAALWAASTGAQENATDAVVDLGTVQVLEKGGAPDVFVAPDMEVIRVDAYEQPGVPQNITDLVRDLPIFDFRGASDLVPSDDTIYMRGFSSRRFVTSVDGLTLRQSGGRKSSHIVDYALLPPWMIEEVEVMPGPHSALYPSKSIGGVLNLKTRTPKRFETPKPDVHLSTSYRSYNTQNHNLDMHGGVRGLIYDAGVQKYSTDGYLRNSKADIETVYGRGGYVQENGGYLALSGSYTDAARQLPVNNDPDDPKTDYDSDYPTVQDASEFCDSQDPTTDKIAQAVNLNLHQPSPWGTWHLAAMYSEENTDRQYDNLDGSDGSWETKWRQWTAKLMNEMELAPGHDLTLGTEMAELFDGYGRCATWKYAYNDHKRIQTWAAFGEYGWDITESLNLRLGLRYESLKAWVNNYSSAGTYYISGSDQWIERNWDQLIPKSYLTWNMDHLAPCMRDTSLALGVSRIWRAPDYHGELNPQGRPSGAWIDPEHGMGYDLVFQRRLWRDVQFKVDGSFYEIRDFLAYNNKYAKFTPSNTNPVSPGQEYRDWMVNLDKVWRKGVEVSLRGHLCDPLSFYLSYAYVDFENKGDEPAGETELDGRARNRFNAGLTYEVVEGTKLLVDYAYQDREVVQNGKETPSGSDNWTFTETTVDAHHLVDCAVEQTLFTEYHGLKDGKLKVFATNVFNESYVDIDGYPATDRTIGVALSLAF
ncbi:TonB-dependent receptor [Desulfoplanes sp. PS50]